jgi:hypothetical protein
VSVQHYKFPSEILNYKFKLFRKIENILVYRIHCNIQSGEVAYLDIYFVNKKYVKFRKRLGASTFGIHSTCPFDPDLMVNFVGKAL